MFLQLPWSFFYRHLSSKHPVAGGMAPEEQQVSSESYVELETQKSMRYDWCSILIHKNPFFNTQGTSEESSRRLVYAKTSLALTSVIKRYIIQKTSKKREKMQTLGSN